MERAPGRMWNAGRLAVVEKGWCGRNGYRFVNFVVKGKDVLGRVDGSCRCHGLRGMERAPGRMWNAGGLAVVEKGWCGRNV
ncbi:hypothetical protein NDU88_007835 [Pleurodeles waltl]|uniref:Uncharacterized protein n=1 Tax=Pleurodeles waltl TaxID=8319 RepID=A0AAV7NXH1_PLEWA|nr:hypothetical protein NDU88_007835 [Pleurodeles waltl]